EKLYRAYEDEDWEATPLDDDDRAELRKRLELVGGLALGPKGGAEHAARAPARPSAAVLEPARRTATVALVVAVVALFLLGSGFLMLMLGGTLLIAGLGRPQILHGSRGWAVY